MGVLHGNPFLLASGTATEPAVPLQRSVRLRSSQSAYFNRTPATAGNRKTWTWSAWVKRGTLGVSQYLFSAGTGGTDVTQNGLNFQADDTLRWTALGTVYRVTTQVFRDPSAWYHIVLQFDTTQSTGNDRIRLYVNGTQITAFSTLNNPTQNLDYAVNQAAVHEIGRWTGASNPFDGYLTEVYFIDGLALTPSSFGGYNAGTNVWEVRKYSGTYGTNGFYLPFTNPASIGADGSGNGNNWTPNNIQTSNSALTTYDSMLDVPTNTGSNNANFAVLNPLQNAGTYSDGNLQVLTTNIGSPAVTIASMGVTSGKWYWELTPTTIGIGTQTGVVNSSANMGTAVGNDANGWGYYSANGNKINNGSFTAYGATYTSNDVIGVALDADAGTLTFYKNGTSQGQAFSGLSGTLFPAFSDGGTGTSTQVANFGQRPFAQTPPSGFKSLNTYNLPEPTIPRGDKYFEQYLYTGNGGGQQIGEIQKPASLFNLDRSLRFRKSNSAFLSRTQTTNTNSVKCTFSGWVKRGELGTLQVVFGGYTGTDADTQLYFDTTNQLKFTSRITNVNGAALEWAGESAAVFRDPQLWLHIVVKVDTSALQATNNAYYTVYVNGIAQTFTTISGASLVTAATVQNRNTCWNVSGYTNTVARHRANHFDGYIADIYFIDGQALDATSFGAFDGNNYWTPKAYTGTYGTNGFHLEFEDFSNNTATTIGKDTSGNGNNFTPTGINVTTPANTNAAWDSMVDVPTQTSADVANFCTLNPLRSFVSGSAATFTNGNLTVSIPTVGNPPRNVTSTYDVFSGKWYWEVIAGTVASNFVIGIASKAMDFNATIFVAGSYLYDATTGNKNIGGTASAYGATYTTNDVIGIALDMDAGTLTFYKNGVSQGVAATGLQGLTVTPVIAASGSSAITGTFNFGQRPFRYSNFGTDRPAATFKPINSFNIAEVLGDVESPDLVWIKSRSAGTHHALFNSVVGTGKYLQSSGSVIEVADVNSLIQFNKNGFLLGNAAIVNASAATFVASAWKAGNTTVTNTAGTISSQVKANQEAGFSIITFTTNNTAGATVGHGLGVIPAMIIMKYRTLASTNWVVYHKNMSTTPQTGYLNLSATTGFVSSTDPWNNTAPTSSVITMGAGVGSSGSTNYSVQSSVAYCFSEIEGYSKFGSYTANNDPNGPFVYTGFRPRWLIVKRATTGTTGGWFMYDTARNTFNVMDKYLFAEGAAGDATLAVFDFTSNGFKIRSNNVHVNSTAGNTYIYMAFAENPFKYALAR